MKNIRLVIVAFLLSALVAFLLLAVPTTSATVNGGVFRFPNTDPSSGTLDPALISYENETAIAQQIFDGLTRFDQSENLVPAIASGWSSSPDQRVFTFTLRSDVYFQNGRQVKASDFVYSWNRARAANGPYSTYFDNISAFTAPSDFMFVATLTNTQSSFLSVTTLPLFFVIPSEAASTIGTNPIGTGPFKFVSWTHGTGGKIVLQANPSYFGGAPYLAGVEYKWYTTSSTQWTDFQANNLDVTQIPTTTWNSVKTDPNVITQSVMLMFGYGIDITQFPSVNVRRAFQQAINRAGIATDPAIASYGSLALAHGVVSPGKGIYDNSDINIPYDPTNALNLLAAAGWTDTNHDGILDNGSGTNLTILIYAANASAPLVQRLKNDLSNVGGTGVGASVTITTNRNAPGIGMQSVGWISDYPDPEDDLTPYVTGGIFALRLHYSNPTFNGFYNTGLSSSDTSTRNAAFHSADYQVVITDAAAIPIYYGDMTPVMKKPYVNGLQYDKLAGHPAAPLRFVWLDLKYLYLPLIMR